MGKLVRATDGSALVVGKVNRSTILRLAVSHGLDVLDRNLPRRLDRGAR